MGARRKPRVEQPGDAVRADRAAVVAVVGAPRFLGRRLVARLTDDPRVERIVAVDLRPPEAVHPKLRFVRVDLTRPGADRELGEALSDEGATSLVHLAFFGSPVGNAAYAHELEAIGTLHVVTAAAAAKLPRFVLQSTTAVYGASPKNPSLLDERRPVTTPRSRFLADKVEAERQVARFAAETPRAEVAVLRLAPVVGPTVQNLFTRYLTAKVAPTVLGYDPLVQALHEDDAVDALARGALADGTRGPFNVVADGVVPLTTALRLCGTKPLPVPHPVAASALDLLRSAGLSPAPASLLDFLRWPWVADGTRAKRELGLEPRHTTRDAIVALAGRGAAEAA